MELVFLFFIVIGLYIAKICFFESTEEKLERKRQEYEIMNKRRWSKWK